MIISYTLAHAIPRYSDKMRYIRRKDRKDCDRKDLFDIFSPTNSVRLYIQVAVNTSPVYTRRLSVAVALKWCVKQTGGSDVTSATWSRRASKLLHHHFNFAAAFRPLYITYPAKNIRRNHEPGTAYTSIASSACRSPAIRHGMHARMSRLLITNINLAGSWLWNANARRRNVSAAACTLATFQERPQGNRYFRAISIPPCNDCVVTTTHRVKFARCVREDRETEYLV